MKLKIPEILIQQYFQRTMLYNNKTLMIAYDVFFTADRSNRYFITKDNNLVKIQGDQLAVIAKLVSTGKSAYPWMFYDGTKNYLLLNAQGTIVSPQGKELGLIRMHGK
ncbi:MAG: hypothetical protein H0W75_11235 [Chitinophagaceae bacterium]|nr:hypothetical protein [Chitinophagaceae bacterium]